MKFLPDKLKEVLSRSADESVGVAATALASLVLIFVFFAWYSFTYEEEINKTTMLLIASSSFCFTISDCIKQFPRVRSVFMAVGSFFAICSIVFLLSGISLPKKLSLFADSITLVALAMPFALHFYRCFKPKDWTK